MSCCSLIDFFEFLIVKSAPRPNGFRDRIDFFDCFKTSHRKIEQ